MGPNSPNGSITVPCFSLVTHRWAGSLWQIGENQIDQHMGTLRAPLACKSARRRRLFWIAIADIVSLVIPPVALAGGPREIGFTGCPKSGPVEFNALEWRLDKLFDDDVFDD